MAVKGVAQGKECKVRINAVIIGEPAKWLIEWKRRGLITSYTNGIIEALKALNEKMTEQDLKLIHLKNLRNEEDL